MTARHFAFPAVIGFGTMLLLGSLAAAQEPLHQTFQIKNLPNFYGHDDLQWQRFLVTVPETTSPLDMHISFIVDGMGKDYVIASPTPWSHSIPLKVQLITEPQRIYAPRKHITYHFGFVTAASSSADTTLTFKHSSLGVGIIEVNGTGEGNVGDKTPGDKISLFDQEIEDTSFHASTKHWNYAGYVKRFPAGMVHRMTIYLSFEPHTGPKPQKLTLSKHPISVNQDF